LLSLTSNTPLSAQIDELLRARARWRPEKEPGSSAYWLYCRLPGVADRPRLRLTSRPSDAQYPKGKCRAEDLM